MSNGVVLLSTAAISGTADRTYLVNPAGALGTGFALDQPFLNRVVTTSTGAIALGANSSAALDFSSPGNLTAASLGAVSGSWAYSGTLTPSGTTYRLGGGGGTLDFQSELSGGRSLVVGGNAAGRGGTVILSNAANSFTGKTSVPLGTLEFTSIGDVAGGPTALGNPADATAGTIDLGSGTASATLRYVGSGHASNRAISILSTVGGTVDASGSGALNMTASTITAAANTTVTLTGVNTAINAIGPIAGTGVNVDKTGPGTWRLTGQSNYSGRLSVLDGTVVVGDPVVKNINSPFGSQTAPALLPIIGNSAAGLTGTATLLADNVTIDRGFSVAHLGASSSQEVVLGNAGSGTATFAAGHDIRLGRDVTLQAAPGGEAIFAALWRDLAGGDESAVAFTVGSAGNDGTVVFGSVLPYAITAVKVRRGTLRVQGIIDEVIGFSTPVTLGETDFGGTLDLNDRVQLLSRLSFAGVGSTVTGSTGSLRLFNSESATYNSGTTAVVNVAGTGHTISTAVALGDAASFTVAAGGRLGISSIISGTDAAKSLTKAGAGILELSGMNSYTGITTVSAGGLLVSGTNSGTGLVSVLADGWIGGRGRLEGGLTLGSTAGLVFDPAGALNVLGSVLIDNAFSVESLVGVNGLGIDWNSIGDGTYTLISNTTSIFNNVANFGPGNARDIGDGRSAYFQNGSLQLVIVPEPGAMALAAVGIAAAVYAARRRRA